MNKAELLVPSGIAMGALFPKAVIDTVEWAKDGVSSLLNAVHQHLPSVPLVGSSAPFLEQVAGGLAAGRFAQWGMDKVGVANKLIRYPVIGGAAYATASSTLAPYAAGAALLWYAPQLVWKLGRKALKTIGKGASHLNLFEGSGGPRSATP